jgi:hypothetical protein
MRRMRLPTRPLAGELAWYMQVFSNVEVGVVSVGRSPAAFAVVPRASKVWGKLGNKGGKLIEFRPWLPPNHLLGAISVAMLVLQLLA